MYELLDSVVFLSLRVERAGAGETLLHDDVKASSTGLGYTPNP
jgi:hypothetical protein